MRRIIIKDGICYNVTELEHHWIFTRYFNSIPAVIIRITKEAIKTYEDVVNSVVSGELL